MKNYIFVWVSMLMLVFVAGCSNEVDQKSSGNEKVSNEEAKPRHLRVVWTENPAEHAIISWTTMASTDVNKIYYDTASRSGDKDAYDHSSEAEYSGKVTLTDMDETEGVPPGWFNHVQLSDLQPSTFYYFVVESDGNVSEEYNFLTAPENDQPIKLLSGGDSRLGGDKPRYAGRTPHVDRQSMNKTIVRLMEENPDLLALAHGADWGDTAEWRHLYWWFEDNEMVKTSDNRLLPFIVARGNHDMYEGFRENFWLGGDIKDYYYTTTIGLNSLITLNTEISALGDQMTWLNEELDEITGNGSTRWVMAQYHRPAYPVAKDYDRPDMVRIRENFTPVFDKYNLDLALESDGHVLKRTLPIRNFEPAEDGVVYIGEGGLGVPQRTAHTERWFLAEPGFAAAEHHVWLLDINAESLNMKAVGFDGVIHDNYTISPRNR